MPGNNHTRSLVLYIAIEAVGWVTVALGFLSAGTGLLSTPAEGSLLPFNTGAATPGVTLAVAGLFAAGLAHHGRIAIEMARSLRHLVHLAATAAESQALVQTPMPPPLVAASEPAAPAAIAPQPWPPEPVPDLEPRPAPEPALEPAPEPPPAPTLPPADLIIPPLPPLPPLEPAPVRTPPTPLFVDFQPAPEAAAVEPTATDPAPQSVADDDEAGQIDASHAGEPDIVVHRNVQIELRTGGIFIRDRQFGSVDEARAFIDRVLDRAPR